MSLPHEHAFAAGTAFFRTTSPNQLTSAPNLHRRVVNGMGARGSRFGARYNYPGVDTVYLTETIETCLAERAFYVQREYLQKLDLLHFTYSSGASTFAPGHTTDVVLWKITFGAALSGIADLSAASAGHFGVYPALMTNPSQDYHHLKDRRAHLQTAKYEGLRAPSSRCTRGGCMVVLFSDVSRRVATIEPVLVRMSLIQGGARPFSNHATDILDFEQIAVQASPVGAVVPPWASSYSSRTILPFRH